MDNLIYHPGLIAAFSTVVVIMLAVDLGIFNKKSHDVSNKEALAWSGVWILLSMIFSFFIYIYAGFEKFSQFQAAYWIEKSLSVDNLFVFILVFGFFNVSRSNHHKVLFWGIVGAIVMRAIFIFTGLGIVNATFLGSEINLYLFKFHLFSDEILGWKFILDHREGEVVNFAAREFFKINIVLTLFGLFLVYAGYKTAFVDDDDDSQDFNSSPGAKFIRKIFTVSSNYDGDKFFTVENGKRLATPLLVVVGVIEATDLLFATDSIPAIFAIAPDDPFILYTANIFAILGLRALYFLLANFIHVFSKLKFGVAVVLVFIGVKMLSAPFYHIKSSHSLFIVGGVLLVSLLVSLLYPGKKNDVMADNTSN